MGSVALWLGALALADPPVDTAGGSGGTTTTTPTADSGGVETTDTGETTTSSDPGSETSQTTESTTTGTLGLPSPTSPTSDPPPPRLSIADRSLPTAGCGCAEPGRVPLFGVVILAGITVRRRRHR